MQQKISKRVVDSLTSGIVWDSELKGFGVRCRGLGKHYVLKMRVGSRQHWISIGRHGSPWTPDLAREEAGRLLRLEDPAAERDRDKNVITVED